MEELDISTITDQYAGVKGSQRDSSDTFQNSPEPPSKEDKIFEPLGVPLTPTGLLSLYDGLAPNLLKEGPPLALYLGIYEALKTALLATDALREEPVLCYLIAGAVGELIGSVVRVPAEAVKSTRQADGTVTMADAMETSFGSERARSNLVSFYYFCSCILHLASSSCTGNQTDVVFCLWLTGSRVVRRGCSRRSIRSGADCAV
jgi:hypothetical protein